MTDPKRKAFEDALGLYRVAVQAGDPTDSYRRLIRLYEEAVKDARRIRNATCPGCENEPCEIIEHEDSVGVRWWGVAESCGTCFENLDAAMSATTEQEGE